MTALVVALCACTGTPASTLGSTSATAGSGGGGGGTASSSATTTGGAGGHYATRLDDTGLIARYYLDTEESMPPVVIDAGLEGLDLAVTQTDNLSFGGDAGRRGMTWAHAAQLDGAYQEAPSARLTAAFDGTQAITYEAVALVGESTPSGGRIIHFGTDVSSGVVTLQTTSASELAVAVQGTVVRIFQWPFATHGRTVLHVVVDLGEPETERVRLFANGSPLAPRFASPIAVSQLSTEATDRLWLGNRDQEGRSFMGTLGYAALYEGALDEDLIANHARILLENDDQP